MPAGVHINSKVVSLRLPLELVAHIETRAASQGMTVNAYLTALLVRWSRKQSMEVKQNGSS